LTFLNSIHNGCNEEFRPGHLLSWLRGFRVISLFLPVKFWDIISYQTTICRFHILSNPLQVNYPIIRLHTCIFWITHEYDVV